MKTKKYLLLALLSSLHLSCKDFVELPPPKNLAVTTKVFQNDDAAISAITNIYAGMNNNTSSPPYFVGTLLGLASDEFANYSTNNGFIQYFTNSYSQTEQPVLNFWQQGYNYIYQANAIYEGCKMSTTISEVIKKQLMAEALFIRAYWHFQLTNLYGDIPIVTSTDYNLNRTLVRQAVSQVYSAIISDLKQAEVDLSVDYLEGNTKTKSNERIRPNKYAACALLARVHLYNKDYADAEMQATKVIDNTTMYKLSTLATVFQKGSSESIWQLATPLPNAITSNTWEAQNFILTAKPATGLVRSTTISNALFSAFEPNDLRKTNWIGSFNESPTIIHRYPNKYKSKSTVVNEENTIVLRMGELFLIRAEARTNLNNFDGARSDLNAIRSRAGLVNTTALDKASLIDAIVKERRVELFSEYGHRWFDLKRLDLIDQIMATYSGVKGSNWTSNRKLLPIPLRDIESGIGLQQNNGYN